MRGVWFVILLVGIGCRAVPETVRDSDDGEVDYYARHLSRMASLAAARADSVPVAPASLNEVLVEQPKQPEKFLRTKLDGLQNEPPAVGMAGSGVSPASLWRPTSPDDMESPGRQSVDSTMLMPLTLDTAIQTVLERNPDLAAIRSSDPVAHAAYLRAKTYPFNPQFQTQVAPYTRDRDGNDAPVSQQHVIVQTFELAHQRRFRTGAAAAEWERVRGNIRAAELMSVAMTERLFFTALYQRDLRDLAQSLAKLNEDLVGMLERRLKAGQANSADVALARLQAQSARRRQRLLEANYQTALIKLRNYLNLTEETEVDLIGRWLGWQWKSVADVLRGTNYESLAGHTPGFSTDSDDDALVQAVRRLVAERPDVAAAYAKVAAARENLALAQAMRTPNLQIGPMWQRDDDATEFWGIQAQIDIPVVNTGTPLVRQRRAELHQQQVTAARLEEKAVLEARAAVRRYARARRLVEQSRGEFTQAMPDDLKPFEDQFHAGQISLLQVFAARTSLAQSRQSFLELLNELALAAADVTQTTGLPAWQLILDLPPPPSKTDILPRDSTQSQTEDYRTGRARGHRPWGGPPSRNPSDANGSAGASPSQEPQVVTVRKRP